MVAISVKRSKENEIIKEQHTTDLRVFFELAADADMSEEQALEIWKKVVRFLTDFGRDKLKDPKGLAGQIVTLRSNDDAPYDRVRNIKDYSGIDVRVGYAQEFQNEFQAFEKELNAEFSAPEA